MLIGEGGDSADLTSLYAARPGMFDPKGKAKYDAWEKVKGEPTLDASEVPQCIEVMLYC